MAKTILRLKHDRKAFHALSLFITILLVMQRLDAIEFKVGGANGWTVPADSNLNTFNEWAEMNRFQIGDSLLFVYPSDNDSVLQVKKEEYDNCNSVSPIESFRDGNTSFKFDKNGPYYFISGVPENCQKNEKMVVVVMADRSIQSSSTDDPSFAPEGGIVPSTPTAKSPTKPPHSGASSMFMNAIASGGAFAGSFLLLVLSSVI